MRNISTATINHIRERRRTESLSIDALARAFRLSREIIAEICDGVICEHVSPGRKTILSQEDMAAIRDALKAGAKKDPLARKYRTSTRRIQKMIDGGLLEGKIPECDKPKRVAPVEELTREAPWDQKEPLNEGDFLAAGIPDTAANRRACRGHSRQWMRLYALSLKHPGYADCGDAEGVTYRSERRPTYKG